MEVKVVLFWVLMLFYAAISGFRLYRVFRENRYVDGSAVFEIVGFVLLAVFARSGTVISFFMLAISVQLSGQTWREYVDSRQVNLPKIFAATMGVASWALFTFMWYDEMR